MDQVHLELPADMRRIIGALPQHGRKRAFLSQEKHHPVLLRRRRGNKHL
jgi:hypothetical protein